MVKVLMTKPGIVFCDKFCSAQKNAKFENEAYTITCNHSMATPQVSAKLKLIPCHRHSQRCKSSSVWLVSDGFAHVEVVLKILRESAVAYVSNLGNRLRRCLCIGKESGKKRVGLVLVE